MNKSELNKKINKCQKEIKDIKDEFVKSNTDLKIGDNIKFTIKGDSYCNIEDKYFSGEIVEFQVSNNGEIRVSIGGHETPRLSDCERI